jgi:predicted ATPase/tetratricopeptide (TPR) repeat protein
LAHSPKQGDAYDTTLPRMVRSMSAANPPLSSRPRWQVQLLGGLHLSDGQQHHTRLPSRAVTALLARLALWPQRAHAREELVDLLWPGVALEVGRNRLRQALSTLKSLLEGVGQEPVLVADRLSVRVVAGALGCDVHQFETAARSGDVAQARAVYTGELLPGFYDEWICEERLRLSQWAEDLPASGLAASAAPPATAPEPLAGPRTRVAARSRLPQYLTRLLGTEAVVTALAHAVQAHRFVTLLAPGGAGKTRLAIEVARQLSHAEAGEPASPFEWVTFVPLVGCQDSTAFADALLGALAPHARDASDVLQAVSQALAGQRTLVVLDNFEQLVEAGGQLLLTCLQHLPELHVLVTSRRVLGLDGEQVFALPALELPDATMPLADLARNPAVALFIDRARAARSDFHLHERNGATIAKLVCSLEGLPLAIELAASRVRSLAPSQLLELLEQARASTRPEPAHALLARGGARAGHDARHASMQEVVSWSWQLLSPAARALLTALTVVPAGCTLDAAVALCGQSLVTTTQALDELVSHSLLRTSGEPKRYLHYEPVREFAAQHTTDTEARLGRHRLRQWFIQSATAEAINGPLEPWRQELPNFAAALALACEDGAADEGVAVWLALRSALSAISLPLGAMALVRDCAHACSDPDQAAHAHALLGRVYFRHGQKALATAQADCAEALMPRQGAARAHVLGRLAQLRWRINRDARVLPMLEEALALAQQEGLLDLQGNVLSSIGMAVRLDDPLRAIALQKQALACSLQSDDRHGQNNARLNMGVAMLSVPALREEALASVTALQRDAAELDDWLQYGIAANLVGELLCHQRRWDQARAAYQDGARATYAAVELHSTLYCLWNMPRALAHLRQAETGARLMGFAEHYWPRHFAPLTPVDRHELRRVRRLLRCTLAPAALATYWGEGAGMTLAQAVALAVAD